METIGFIGLGRMGKSMAGNLLAKGFALTVLDIDPRPARELAERGATIGASVAQIARDCTIVITMLPTAVEVEQIATGPDGVFAHAARGSLLMDMSTIDPLATDRLQAAALARGLSVVDAPVGRLAEHADRGESLFMVGASGGRTKLVNNFVAVTLTQVNAEALALSQRFGLDLTRTLAVLLGTSANNGQLRMNFPNKVLAGDTTPGFTIDLAHKDLALVLGAAHAARVPMPVAAAVFESFSLARAAGYGGLDFSGIADANCDVAKIERARVPKGWTPG